MNNILKVGIIHSNIPEQNDLDREVMDRLTDSYGGYLFVGFNNNFKVPCAAECGDNSCTKELNCDIIKYSFHNNEDMIRCGKALHMFEPVVGIQYNDYFWNKYDQDGENVLDKQEGLN